MRRSRPPLITDAADSQDDQLHAREVRYILMMTIRVACLLVAAVLVGMRAPLLWLWIPLLLVGMVVVPWLAVLLANDRPPKDRHRLRPPRSDLREAPDGPGPRPVTGPVGRVIEPDE